MLYSLQRDKRRDIMGMLHDFKSQGERFEGVFMIEWREASFRNKPGTYVVLTCQDVSGSLGGKIWEVDQQKLQWLKENYFFKMTGQITEFRGILELAIESLLPVPESEIDLDLFLPASPHTAEDLEERLLELKNSIEDPFLSILLERLLFNSPLANDYRHAPAAKKIHQAYLRGLWEHSVKVAEIASSICSNYPEINCDLVITGALLHDIGKVKEYEYSRGIELTNEGRLMGHILIGIELVNREVDMILGFPQELRVKLSHILASHHGRYEWQSPKRPKLMEGFVVHYANGGRILAV